MLKPVCAQCGKPAEFDLDELLCEHHFDLKVDALLLENVEEGLMEVVSVDADGDVSLRLTDAGIARARELLGAPDA